MSDHFKEEIEGHSSSVDAFFALRDNWSTIGRQVETAIDVFLGSYHTGQRTVRFLFGDFVEWVLYHLTIQSYKYQQYPLLQLL